MHHATITGTGSYVPERVLTNADLSAMLDEEIDDFVSGVLGIRERRVCAPDESTADLAEAAARRALDDAGLEPSDLDLLIVATDTPEYVSPATSSVLHGRLGATRAGTFDLNCGCAGYVTALDAAAKYIRADDRYARVLVVAAYAMSKFLDYADKKTATIFADGAGATVVERSDAPGVLAAELYADGRLAPGMGVFAGGTAEPITEAVLQDGYRNRLRFVEKYPREINEEGWPRIARSVLARAGYGIDDVDLWLWTQVNRSTIEVVMERLGADDVAPVATPLFHTGAWNVFATPLWHRGGRVVLFDGFDAADFLAGLEEEGCTVALTVPTQLLMLVESAGWGRELPALRFFISGGAPCPPSLAERARAAGYGFREGYGLTECGPNCFALSTEEAARRPGQVGRPIPYLEMRIAHPDGSDAAPGEPGELWLRGPQLFGGYLNAPERTAEAFAPGGWLRTGDLARQDTDGVFAICGRSKEMYISGGENVFPGEVEAALVDCPGVAEAAIIGVPDARWGEVGRAYVVRRAGAAGLALDEAAVEAHARARLAGYKVPKSVVFVDALPRLGSGKLDRRALSSYTDAGAVS